VTGGLEAMSNERMALKINRSIFISKHADDRAAFEPLFALVPEGGETEDFEI
jgi:hypothetical protein